MAIGLDPAIEGLGFRLGSLVEVEEVDLVEGKHFEDEVVGHRLLVAVDRVVAGQSAGIDLVDQVELQPGDFQVEQYSTLERLAEGCLERHLTVPVVVHYFVPVVHQTVPVVHQKEILAAEKLKMAGQRVDH